MFIYCLNGFIGLQSIVMEQENVGVLHINIIRLCSSKILYIIGHDNFTTATYCSCYDMSVVSVFDRNSIYKRFIPRNNRIRESVL